MIQTLKKNSLFVEKWHEKFDSTFDSSNKKTKNLNFDVLSLSKVCNVWAKIIQTSCDVKSDLWFQKGHKEFGKFSHKLKEVLDKFSAYIMF